MTDTIVGSGFSIPKFDDEAPAEPRTRNPRKKAQQRAASKLIEALEFVSVASDPKSKYTWQQHARFAMHYATASNGNLRAGHPIEEDLTICPHIKMLSDALKKCGVSVAMTALDNGRMSIVGGPAKFTVPCIPGDQMPPVMFAPSIAPIDDRIKAGFKAVLKLAKDEAETVYEANLLLRANTVVGSNGALVMEFWHGNDLPPALNVPQAFCKAVVGVASPLVGFGWIEGRSITFHFENGAWLATQLGEGIWPPQIDNLLNAECTLEPCPQSLFDGLDAIVSFSKDGAIHFHEDRLKTTYAAYAEEQQGAPYGGSYDVPGLRGHHSFSGALLKLAKPGCVEVDYVTHEDRMIFYNKAEWLRGVLMKRIG